MDDLIGRKEAVSRISDLLILELHGEKLPTWNEVYNAIGDIPSAPAIPLDQLCEWLARFGRPCEINDGMCDMSHGVDRCLGIFNSSSFCWKYLLTKWMEEQDAAD